MSLEAILFLKAGDRKVLHKGLQECSAEEITGAMQGLMEEYRNADRQRKSWKLRQMRTKVAYKRPRKAICQGKRGRLNEAHARNAGNHCLQTAGGEKRYRQPERGRFSQDDQTAFDQEAV